MTPGVGPDSNTGAWGSGPGQSYAPNSLADLTCAAFQCSRIGKSIHQMAVILTNPINMLFEFAGILNDFV